MINLALRTIFFYFFITLIYRMMGKREVAQLGLIDLVVSILIAELAAISIENYDSNILKTVIPITILTIIEVLFAYLTMKFRKFGRFFEGKPSILINNGKIVYNNLVKERYSLDDLLFELRQNNIYSVEEVEYAILEVNGKLSIFPYSNNKSKYLPLPVIIEGKIQHTSLKLINKSELWLERVVNYNNLNIKDIFYAIYKEKELYIIKSPNK